MLDDFLFRAFLGGIGVAIVTGPLGCFVVWRRLAYFGDTLAFGAFGGRARDSFGGQHNTRGIRDLGIDGSRTSHAEANSPPLVRCITRFTGALNTSAWTHSALIYDVGAC